MVTVQDLKKFFAWSSVMWAVILMLALLSIANGAEVVLTSDPPGSVISVGGKDVGITPLTLNLPAGQPVEITSRFGPLSPVVHTLTPDDGRIVADQFQHEYGTMVVTCDRTDAALMIDGTGYGHPPAVILISPGRHKLFMTASDAPDKTRAVEVQAGQRATVEMDFSGGSPETAKTSMGPQTTPDPSPSPAPKASPSPKSRGVKPLPLERGKVVWEEPPPLIPPAPQPAEAAPSPASAPRRKSASKPEVKSGGKSSTSVALAGAAGNVEKGKAAPSPSPPAIPDKTKAQAAIRDLWLAQEEELKAEKAQIEQGIKSSTGTLREQWKSRLAVWREKMKTAKQDAKVAEAAVR
jgi:PEGA domain